MKKRKIGFVEKEGNREKKRGESRNI